MDLEHYFAVWVGALVFSTVNFLLTFCLRETLQREDGALTQDFGATAEDPTSRVDHQTQRSVVGIDGSTSVISFVWKDKFVLSLLCIIALVFIAIFGGVSITFGFSMTVLGYGQATASLVGIVNPAMEVVGFFVASRVMGRWGPSLVICIGLAMLCIGFVLGFLVVVFADLAEILFWFGGVLRGFSAGFAIPAMPVLLSVRVRSTMQGTLLSFSVVMQAIGSVVGSVVWSSVLWNNTSQGVRAGIPWLASAFMSGLALLWFLALQLCAHPPVAESSVDLQNVGG